ncbi:MAG: methyltransferase domain-containing protein [Candidatus Saganbacteria bacterium]|nr:methyltransferase domain-containing protein [Candidatus Saganbacteria bacterium]
MKEEEIRKRDVFNKYLELVKEDIDTIFKDKGAFIDAACPACGSDENTFQFEKSGFKYVLCNKCGTLFANPRPTLKALTDFYSSSKSGDFWVKEFFLPVAEVRREKLFKPRAELVSGRLQEPEGFVGDVGAGFGIFLEELGKVWKKAKMAAIEPSIEMSDICTKKGFTVIRNAVEDVTGWDGKFSVLTAFELFEHLQDPGSFLEKIHSLLSKGGHLLLSTLNGEGFDIQILWERSKSVSPPHHLNFFNPDSMRILLEKKGFAVESITTPGKLDWDIVEGAYRKEGQDPGRLWKLLSQKGNEQAKEKLQEWITKNNFSSHMMAIARKGNQ